MQFSNINKNIFYDFIKCTETPMSIAIQGDWGTGKTSKLNLIMNFYIYRYQNVFRDGEVCQWTS